MPRLDDADLFARPASKLLGRHFGYGCDELLALAAPALDGLVSVTHSNSKGLVEASAPRRVQGARWSPSSPPGTASGPSR